MKRVKKLYSLNESTIDFIKEYARELNINESWALDLIIANFERIMNSKKKKPIDSREESSAEWFNNYWNEYSKSKKSVK